MVNNADWLLNLNYIDFLREVGVHFSVNRMLTFECFKQRLERGLSFMEFNYMLMQSYDFFYLNQQYGCTLELGGDDQWSNILGGVELCRRKAGKRGIRHDLCPADHLRGPKKMGKTEKGAVWLDPDKTPPYEFSSTGGTLTTRTWAVPADAHLPFGRGDRRKWNGPAISTGTRSAWPMN